MKIEARYSHLNGYEHLLVHQPGLWSEIEEVIRLVNADEHKTKISKEIRMQGRVLFSPPEMNKAFKALFEVRGWMESRTAYWVTRDHQLIRKTVNLPPSEQRAFIEAAGEVALPSFNQTDLVKDRVAIEVQFGKYAFVAYDLFVKHMAFFVGDLIDVGIEIVPMKSLAEQMSSGVPYYERSLYDLIRQGRSTPAVPLVMLGLAP